MNEECLFCNFENFELVAENRLSFAIRDKYPAASLHTLILSKNHYKNVFDLPPEELVSILHLAKVCREQIIKVDNSVKGFNFGTNAGFAAGQRIEHVHFHLIPRRIGDSEPPAGRS
ncbi:MAG: HIT family protein [Pseudomonadota bacterium]